MPLASNPVVRAVLPVGSRRRRAVGSMVRTVMPGLAPPPKPKPKSAKQLREEELARRKAERARLQEEAKLKRVWQRQRPDLLEVYLVTGYQDPRLNGQSILARHTLIRALFGSAFDRLMREELAHAAKLNNAIFHRGEELGVRPTATMDPEKRALIDQVMEVVADELPVFGERWRQALAGRTVKQKLRVLEFACGSANDYRAFADYGLAAYLDYTGIDLNDSNIANAKARFPDVDFRVDSILSLSEPDDSVDFVIGFDILEHLSLDGMFTALETAERIARRGLTFAFFRMDEVPEHEEIPRGAYHYNLLSLDRMREYMEQRYRSVQLIHVAKMFEDDYGFPHSYRYNRRAYTLIARKPRRLSWLATLRG
jgi:ubiquinone/menaquinone biosynthesis C-methylase UbiE